MKHKLPNDLEGIFEDPIGYGRKAPVIKRFKTKYTEELRAKDLPPEPKYPRLELKDTEYAKLFMQNNPIHDHDREKASSISQNITYNKGVVDTNPYFGKVLISDYSIPLSKKEMYRYVQWWFDFL